MRSRRLHSKIIYLLIIEMLYVASIILNIVTILIVILGIVIIHKVVKSVPTDVPSAHDAFESALKDPSNMIRNFYADKKEGNIGTFTGSMSKFTNSL